MSRATEITTSRRGDVTNARDKQTVLCPLLISNYWTGGCCDCGCAWFYCLLRSYKSTFQLCGLSEHVDVAFITNQKWVWLLSDCYVLWKVLVHVLFEARGVVLSCVLIQESSVMWILYATFPLYAYHVTKTLKYTPYKKQMKGSKHSYTPACTAILVFTGFHAEPRCSQSLDVTSPTSFMLA